jgi:ribosomal protein S18 acetylase RimI-like enzyme
VTGIRIVEYEPQHEVAVVELMAELQEFERALSADRAPGPEMACDHFAYLRALCAERSGQVFVALVDGDAVGFAVVFLEAEDEADRHLLPPYRSYGWLSDLYVKPRFRDRAVGSRLIEAAARHCIGLGTRQLRLAVLSNNTGACGFYEKSGFYKHEIIYATDL